MTETEQWQRDVTQEGYVERLREALNAKNMSQAKFAKICGCSPSRISALLNKRYFGYTPKYIWEKAKIHLDM